VERRLLLATSLLVVTVSACGGEPERAAEPATSQPTPAPTTGSQTTTEAPPTTEATSAEAEPPPPTAPPGVPAYAGGYRRWVKLNGAPIPPRAADPHEGTKNVYASRERRSNGRFPFGTIVVKEASRPGRDFIGLIAIMRKERGADPAHNDWRFVEFTREARDERFQEIARGAVCWSCHVGALEDDYVFTE
jgi:Cytochrome P460